MTKGILRKESRILPIVDTPVTNMQVTVETNASD